MSALRSYSPLDRCLLQIDLGLRTLLGKPQAERASPAQHVCETVLTSVEQRTSAGLMRVDHAGEVAAQALYQGQAFTARKSAVRASLKQSAIEENDHLAWCEQRLRELNSHTSYLNPVWYLGSLLIGMLAGLAGDRWNLGFIVETEKQVVAHIEDHLQQLPAMDNKSRYILEQMRLDESHHATLASAQGAEELPEAIKIIMRMMSKVMTTTAYWV